MNIFFDNLPIYYINLNSRQDRNNSMLSQFKDIGIDNFNRVEAVDKNTIIENNTNMSNSEIACSISHLKAISMFLDSSFNYAMICEDDSDLTNASKINFNFSEIVGKDNDKDFCLQTSVVLRKEDQMIFNIKNRSFWDFGTMSYIVNKKYAKKIVDTYFLNNIFMHSNFISKKVLDPRGGEINTRPVADELIYSLCETKVFPLFSFILSESDIGSTDEYYSQFKKSKKDFISHWNMYKEIKIEDVI